MSRLCSADSWSVPGTRWRRGCPPPWLIVAVAAQPPAGETLFAAQRSPSNVRIAGLRSGSPARPPGSAGSLRHLVLEHHHGAVPGPLHHFGLLVVLDEQPVRGDAIPAHDNAGVCGVLVPADALPRGRPARPRCGRAPHVQEALTCNETFALPSLGSADPEEDTSDSTVGAPSCCPGGILADRRPAGSGIPAAASIDRPATRTPDGCRMDSADSPVWGVSVGNPKPEDHGVRAADQDRRPRLYWPGVSSRLRPSASAMLDRRDPTCAGWR